MGRRAAEHPAGRVSEVFDCAAERQVAYDFLESPHTQWEGIAEAMGAAAAARSVGLPYVVVPVHDCVFSLLNQSHDVAERKDFGAIGAAGSGLRGMHAITGLVLTPQGVALGVGAMKWWSRPRQPHGRSRPERELARLDETELGHWASVLDKTRAQLAEHAPAVVPWFQLDRGGDVWRLMRFLHEGGYHFTVRARANRCVLDRQGRRRRTLELLCKSPLQGVVHLPVRAQPQRQQRVARLHVRASAVTLRLRNPGAWQPILMPVIAVWVHEVWTTPRNEKPIDWLLWTSARVETFGDLLAVVRTYGLRWRIEDPHKTWKSGACRVEETQLHRVEHATKWATLLAAVAARVERLKHLARNEPALPASVELHPREIQALLLLKGEQKKRTEQLSPAPTIAQAVRWIADLGGYTGQRSSGPPGSIVIARGLEKLSTAALLLEALERAPARQ